MRRKDRELRVERRKETGEQDAIRSGGWQRRYGTGFTAPRERVGTSPRHYLPVMSVHIAGGGLAGSEAAWQLAERGVPVVLHEMRPVRQTAAHRTGQLAELVCSNTFKSTEVTNAHGLLKEEMRALGCMVLAAADGARSPGRDRPGGGPRPVRGGGHGPHRGSPADHGRARRGDGDPEPGHRRHRSAHLRHPRGRTARAAGCGGAGVLRRDRAGRGRRHDRPRRRVPGVAVRQGDDSGERRTTTDEKPGRGAGQSGERRDKGARTSIVRSRATSTRRSSTRSGRPICITGTSSIEAPYFEGCLPVEVMAARGR